MNLKLALLVDACRSGNSTHRLVATGHGIRSLSVNMSPISRATSHGAQRVGRFRTEKDRTSKTSGRISPISGASSTVCPVGRNRSVRSNMRSGRSDEHTSELQSLMRISYAVFCLKKKNRLTKHQPSQTQTHNK